jgi:alpha-amylase/alpha-mannosidase (GH57 family)
MEKFICIHGHFYQPPRENAWLEAVELQDSAAPYHDWNERVTAECYAPNGHARLLDGEGRIQHIVNNYSRMSFNFGPTLLSWMKEKAPDIYQAIVEADKASQGRFSGHGSAIAQCYNHMIMPLANARDKSTQVLWGIRDFESRFGRVPEGMWLPETAADNESLEVLAAAGIRFTILSPYQAKRMRTVPGGGWEDVNGGQIDPSRPYLVKLREGRTIAVFFYDGLIAKAVAFENLLGDGGRFADRLATGFSDTRDWDQMAQIATDGESYGHHSRFGDMALAYALGRIETEKKARLTIYAEYLAKHPLIHEVEIHQGSAWSCSHGLDRWRRDCGCNSGGHAGWNQAWREPLRQALDWLRDEIAPRFEEKTRALVRDPWGARDDYINVILDRAPASREAFLSRNTIRKLSEEEQITVMRLMELQRHAMLMYTSCGWFFDEISGLESVQVIQYAARVIELARQVLEQDLEAGFRERLSLAKSNIPEHRDGGVIYDKFVKPAIMTREKVAAHFAVSSLFESYGEKARIYAFTIEQHDRKLFTAGNTKLAVGRVQVTFEVTGNSDEFTYAAIHMGDHNLNCSVRFARDGEAYAVMEREMREAFERGDFPETIRVMDRHFGETHYSIKSLFRDEQRHVLRQILAGPRQEIHHGFRLLTDRYAPLMRFLADMNAPMLKPLQLATGVVLNSEMRAELEKDAPDYERVRCLLAECQATKTELESDTLAYGLKKHVDSLIDAVLQSPEDAIVLDRLVAAASLAQVVPFAVNLWKAQNAYYVMSGTILPKMRERARNGDEAAKAWVEKFLTLGQHLNFHLDETGN